MESDCQGIHDAVIPPARSHKYIGHLASAGVALESYPTLRDKAFSVSSKDSGGNTLSGI